MFFKRLLASGKRQHGRHLFKWGNRWNILGFNFTKSDALSSVCKISMFDPDLKNLRVKHWTSKRCLFLNLWREQFRTDRVISGINKREGLTWPFLVGTNVMRAKEVLNELKDSGIPVTTADNLDEAAMKAVNSLST